jgi:hypothetical protein
MNIRVDDYMAALPKEQQEVIAKRSAELIAEEAAGRVIEELHLISLSVEDRARFADLLLHPPEPPQALKRAKEAHARLVHER